MKVSRNPIMEDAAQLTRQGKLREAVDLLQRTLQGGRSAIPAGQAADKTIDGEYQVLDKGPVENEELNSKVSGQSPSSPAGATADNLESPDEHLVLSRKPWRRSLHRMPMSRPAPETDPLVDGARFINESYTNSAGTRSYKLYIPSGFKGQPLPLIVMLHGCTQDPDDFATGTRMNSWAERKPCLVLYPAQAQTANGSKCWNWFMSADQRRGQGEPSIIAGMTRQILDRYPVDSSQVYIAGLSAGGAMALVMAMTYPELYAAVGVHSGLPYGVAHDLPTGLALMGPNGKSSKTRQGGTWHTAKKSVPAIVFHGDHDTTVHPQNADQVIAQCVVSNGRTSGYETDASVAVERGQVSQGYAYTRTRHSDHRGSAVAEQWVIHGAGHAWSGGSARGSYTDPQGPDATQEMLRFFYAQARDQGTTR